MKERSKRNKDREGARKRREEERGGRVERREKGEEEIRTPKGYAYSEGKFLEMEQYRQE